MNHVVLRRERRVDPERVPLRQSSRHVRKQVQVAPTVAYKTDSGIGPLQLLPHSPHLLRVEGRQLSEGCLQGIEATCGDTTVDLPDCYGVRANREGELLAGAADVRSK